MQLPNIPSVASNEIRIRKPESSTQNVANPNTCLLYRIFRPLNSDSSRLTPVFCILTSDFWLLASGFWLLASGFWLLNSPLRAQRFKRLSKAFSGKVLITSCFSSQPRRA